MTFYKPMLSQIQGGSELRSDVDTLQESLKDFKDKIVKDIVRVQMTATYDTDHFTITLPEEFDSLVPGADKGTSLAMYNLDNTAVIDENGDQLTLNLSDMTMSGTPSKVDEEASSALEDGEVAYAPVTETFTFKCFPVGTFSLFNLPDNYLLDNNEMQLISYDKALHSIVADLSQDQSLIDKVSELVGEEAVAAQINKVKEELTNADTALGNRITAVEGYVKADGIDANSKKIINVLDGEISSESTDAVNGKQLDAIDKAYKAADSSIQESVSGVQEDLEAKNSAMNDRVTVIEGFVTSGGINAGNQKVTNVLDGEVVSEGKDAVNGGQLYVVKTNVDTNTGKISELEGKLNAATVSITLPVEHVQEFALTEEASNEFVLEAKPNNTKITVNINGIVYEEGMGVFTVDREEANKVVWNAASDLELKQDVAEKIFIRFFEDKVSSIPVATA